MVFHILELRKVKFFVPVEAHNRFLFLVSCEWMSLFFFRKEPVDGFWDTFISDPEHSYSYSINKDFVDRQYLKACMCKLRRKCHNSEYLLLQKKQ